MERMLILNASPRAPRSNSKVYAQMVAHGWGGPAACREVLSPAAFPALRRELEQAAHLVLVFPLYADSLPVPLVRFLKELEAHPPAARPTVSVVVNCGFLEPQQNDLAVEMVRLFCRRNGYPLGSVLEIASGEAILGTPFRFLVERACRRLARSVRRGQHRLLRVTMPLPKWAFLRASTAYWTAYGRRFGVTPEQMADPGIEAPLDKGDQSE